MLDTIASTTISHMELKLELGEILEDSQIIMQQTKYVDIFQRYRFPTTPTARSPK